MQIQSHSVRNTIDRGNALHIVIKSKWEKEALTQFVEFLLEVTYIVCVIYDMIVFVIDHYFAFRDGECAKNVIKTFE